MTTPPTTAELVGVAGTGKSTLTRALCRDGAVCAEILHTRRRDHWPYVARAAPSVASLVAASRGPSRRPGWEELKFALYASSWDRYLRDTAPTGADRLVILDQGPVFALARLLWGDSRMVSTRRFDSWIDTTLRRWASALDAILWLDAPDEVLLARIDRRAQGHEVKGVAAEQARQVLGRHRAAYARVRHTLEAIGSPRIVDIDTSTGGPLRVAELARLTLAGSRTMPADAPESARSPGVSVGRP